MVKASALHLALVIALVVTILLGSLSYLHYFYRSEQQKIDRWQRLAQEIEAGTMLALSNDFAHTQGDSLLPSPLNSQDSLRVGKQRWGLFDAISIRSWRNQDSLKRTFLGGLLPQDSTVLYIVDEDRPLSISGKTVLQGVAVLPKSGMRPAFVDGEFYEGIEEMVDGEIKESERSLPGYDAERLQAIHALLGKDRKASYAELPSQAVLHASFFEATQRYRTVQPTSIMQDTIDGNLMIIADSAISISASTYWKDAIVIAPYIKLEDYFQGSGQFYALDSLRTGKGVVLRYPSVLAVLAPDSLKAPRELWIGENSRIEGFVLVHRSKPGEQKDILTLAKNTVIQGDAVSFGLFKYSDPVTVGGSVYCYRFITQRTSSLYENYLINLRLERARLNPHHIRAHFWSTDRKQKQAIAQWLR